MKSVEERIKERTGCDAILDVVLKGNGYKTVCRIDTGAEGMQAMIYYNANQSDDDIVEYIVSQYESKVKGQQRTATNLKLRWLQVLSSKEGILNNVYPILMSGKVKIDKENIPNMPLLDMTIIYRILMEDGSAMLHNQILKQYGITLEELHEASLRNAGTRGLITSLEESLGFTEDDINNLGFRFLAVTYRDHHYGAGAILSPIVVEKVKDKLKSDSFYIIPSSVHEVICVSTKSQILPDALKEMIHEANGSTVLPDEYLSDTLYLYKDGKWEVV